MKRATITIAKNHTMTASLRGCDTDECPVDIGSGDFLLPPKWSSSNPAIVGVKPSQDGLEGTITPRRLGTSIIYATYMIKNQRRRIKSFKISVVRANHKSIQLTLQKPKGK